LPRWIPFLVPPAYLVCILALQPADRLGPADGALRLSLFLYDDYDATALALRALNAQHERSAGRLDPPPKLPAEEFRARLAESSTDLQPRYFLEYPQAVLWLFQSVVDDGPRVASPAVLDGCHNSIVEHAPQNEDEHVLWTWFRGATQVYRVGMTAVLLVLLAVTLACGSRLNVLLLLLPGALYFAVNRFDVLPALLTACAFSCLERRWILASAVCLGAATLVKVYPVLLAPLVVRYLWVCRRDALAWTAAYAATLGSFLILTTASADWEAIMGPYRYQLSRPLEHKWTLYGYVLPRFLGENHLAGSLFRLGSVLGVLGVCLWRRPEDVTDLLRRCACVLLLFVALQVF
jgi:hypothetical protein